MTPNREILKTISEAYERFSAAIARGDACAVAALYAENGEFMAPGAPIVAGRANIEQAIAGLIEAGVKGVRFMTRDVEADSDTAIETGGFTLMADGGIIADEGKYVVIWKREGGAWHMHRDIFNSNRPPAD